MIWLALLVQRRRREQRDAEQAREMAFLLAHGDLPGVAPAADRSVPTPISAERPAAERAVPRQDRPEPANAAERRLPYLNTAQAAAFRRLVDALPGHVIFPRGSLRRAAGLAAIERDARLDFVICTPALLPVAAVDLDREGASAPVDAFKRDTLRQAGVRYAVWRRDALPDAAAIAAWLLD
ncbi:DUF2726 domain-containing protein [Denitromonas iodatirespirans]|uniref:DUF2726 domain-containing protein n=1 Tax=Denitromonas iodatirespirans TaxID=2795389 RepID=A0A944H8J6_DENI1|nr:DUF2726 domain-containing protein [Denitromonas iodatirespirans]MBT0961450.1 DUF2726 domain-containing protein [Denitromonas iodatirespirans]